MKVRQLIPLIISALSCSAVSAASFDCAKTAKPLEKLICANPELDAADAKMGELYKQVSAGFQLNGFLPA